MKFFNLSGKKSKKDFKSKTQALDKKQLAKVIGGAETTTTTTTTTDDRWQQSGIGHTIVGK